MKFSRRESLRTLLASAVGAAMGLGHRSPQATENVAIDGTIFAVGFTPRRCSESHGAAESMLTRLDLSDGKVTQSLIGIAKGHSVILLKNKKLLVLPLDGASAVVVNERFQEIQNIPAPTGYLFSGHGVPSEDFAEVFVSLRRQNASDFSHVGKIGVIDTRNFRVIRSFSSGGVRPHDLVWMPSGLLAISHYGDINYESPGPTYANQRQPKLVLIDVNRGSIVNDIVTPVDGSLTHLAVASNGLVCAVPLSYYPLDTSGMEMVRASLQQEFEQSIAEDFEGRLGAPMPIYMLDSTTGRVQKIYNEPIKQRRAQTVVFHRQSDSFFVSFSFSDTIAKINAKNPASIQYLDGFDLGLNIVRGLAAIDSTNFIAVSGEFRGITLLDAQSMKAVKRFNVSLYDNAHLSYQNADT